MEGLAGGVLYGIEDGINVDWEHFVKVAKNSHGLRILELSSAIYQP